MAPPWKRSVFFSLQEGLLEPFCHPWPASLPFLGFCSPPSGLSSSFPLCPRPLFNLLLVSSLVGLPFRLTALVPSTSVNRNGNRLTDVLLHRRPACVGLLRSQPVWRHPPSWDKRSQGVLRWTGFAGMLKELSSASTRGLSERDVLSPHHMLLKCRTWVVGLGSLFPRFFCLLAPLVVRSLTSLAVRPYNSTSSRLPCSHYPVLTSISSLQPMQAMRRWG